MAAFVHRSELIRHFTCLTTSLLTCLWYSGDRYNWSERARNWKDTHNSQ